MPANLLGIEIGGTKLQVVIGDSEGNISQALEVAADAVGGAVAILRQLETMAQQLLSNSEDPICGIGIGFGGPVNSETGVVILSNQVSGWENLSLVSWAQQQFQLPAVVANDTDLAAIAESRVGGGKHDRCVFYTNIGSGIGGGLVVDGELYSRPGGAMEVGHNWVYSELEGKHGELEEFCSGWALDHQAKEAIPGSQSATAATLFSVLQQGDEAALRIMHNFLDCYGRTLANIIVLLNPDVVIIGGGVAQSGNSFLEAIRQRVAELVYQPFASGYRIELTSLGKLAVPVGALLLAAELG